MGSQEEYSLKKTNISAHSQTGNSDTGSLLGDSQPQDKCLSNHESWCNTKDGHVEKLSSDVVSEFRGAVGQGQSPLGPGCFYSGSICVTQWQPSTLPSLD